MRDYESIFILNPTLDEAESEKVNLRMQEVIKGNGGEVVRVEKWGKRKLAYPIRKHKKGEYVLVQFQGAVQLRLGTSSFFSRIEVRVEVENNKVGIVEQVVYISDRCRHVRLMVYP